MMRLYSSVVVAVFICCAALPALCLPSETRADLVRYAKRWDSIREQLVAEKKALGPGDPNNPNDPVRLMSQELSRKIAHAGSKATRYRQASQTEGYYWSIASDTWAGTTADLTEVTGVFLSKWRQWALPLLTGGWADVTKLAIDSVLRQKIRKGIRARLDCGAKGLARLEDDLVEIVTGSRDTARGANEGYLHGKALGKSLDPLKKVYTASVERQMKKKLQAAAVDSTEKVSKWTKGYAKKVTEKVMSRIDAASFAADVGFKLWMWFDLKGQVEAQTSHLANLRKRYSDAGRPLSCDEAYDVWKKKAQVPLPGRDDPPAPGKKPPEPPLNPDKDTSSAKKPDTPPEPPVDPNPGADSKEKSGSLTSDKEADTDGEADPGGGGHAPGGNSCMLRAHKEYLKSLDDYNTSMADPGLTRHEKETLRRQQGQRYREYQKKIVECAE